MRAPSVIAAPPMTSHFDELHDVDTSVGLVKCTLCSNVSDEIVHVDDARIATLMTECCLNVGAPDRRMWATCPTIQNGPIRHQTRPHSIDGLFEVLQQIVHVLYSHAETYQVCRWLERRTCSRGVCHRGGEFYETLHSAERLCERKGLR